MEKAKLLDVCDVYQPSTIATKKFIANGKYTVYGANGAIGKYDKYNHENSEVLMACRGASCGAINVSEPYSWINGNAMVIHPNGTVNINQKYLMYFLIYANKDKIITGTAQPQITRQNLKDFEIFIGDEEEQIQIVDFIETMLSKLDDGIATLKKTKQQLSVYRKAVLEKTFSCFQKKERIRNVSSLVTSGSRGWAKYYSSFGAVFIRIGNLNRKDININLDDVQYVQLPEKAEGTRSKLMPNDVLVSITADLGSIGFVTQHIGEAYINQHIALIRFNHEEQGQFFAWYLRSSYGQKELLKNKRGNGKLGLGLDDIRDTEVPVVSDEVANSIVSEISNKISICDRIEKTVDSALQESESLRQSILKQAFEGGV